VSVDWTTVLSEGKGTIIGGVVGAVVGAALGGALVPIAARAGALMGGALSGSLGAWLGYKLGGATKAVNQATWVAGTIVTPFTPQTVAPDAQSGVDRVFNALLDPISTGTGIADGTYVPTDAQGNPVGTT
jgi:phage tail tape-measure protein